MKIKNIVFDFGGVLMDWDPVYYYKDKFESEDAMDHFLENVCTHDWNIQQDAGRSLQEATEERVAKFPEYEKHIRDYYSEWEQMLKSDIYENTYLVGKLKEKSYPLYGLTNWSAETFGIAFRRYGVFQLFDGIVVSGEEKTIKPESKIYKILLERYQLKAEECLFIDDNLQNIEAAERLGFQTIHCPSGTNLKLALENLGLI
ncbi:Phosphorylated carbohydrates phosphatase TM_1254 [Candidatus Ornithobacterium hominis]|uniref:HAD family hydrolase n=1 Tax=Candidatus Ornithobacterium hominis TaxID=2497989 RepID=UPI000E5B3E1A|nr:HAD family phosphatase [Candidatus Ornithobacterium hominis]SZD72158.1 Phosphorylated carbohydrates phosphatase TM_1254 [Candidatus Ornithobacterium hominis]